MINLFCCYIKLFFKTNKLKYADLFVNLEVIILMLHLTRFLSNNKKFKYVYFKLDLFICVLYFWKQNEGCNFACNCWFSVTLLIHHIISLSASATENLISTKHLCEDDLNLTFFQACYLDWEARGGDIVYSHLPLSTAFLQFPVLYTEWLDGESTVPARDPRHIGWGLSGHRNSGSVWSFWRWKEKKKIVKKK